MFYKMAEVMGWSHQEMMEMPKRVFYRYYGYWFAEQLMQQEANEESERKQKAEQRRKERGW